MKNTSIQIYFTVYGTFDPNELSMMIELTPLYIWRKGQLREGFIKLFEEDDGWVFSSAKIESLSVSQEIEGLLEIIESKRDSLLKYIKNHNLQSEIGVEIYVQHHGYPEINITTDLLNRILSLGCNIDIDIL